MLDGGWDVFDFWVFFLFVIGESDWVISVCQAFHPVTCFE